MLPGETFGFPVVNVAVSTGYALFVTYKVSMTFAMPLMSDFTEASRALLR